MKFLTSLRKQITTNTDEKSDSETSSGANLSAVLSSSNNNRIVVDLESGSCGYPSSKNDGNVATDPATVAAQEATVAAQEATVEAQEATVIGSDATPAATSSNSSNSSSSVFVEIEHNHITGGNNNNNNSSDNNNNNSGEEITVSSSRAVVINGCCSVDYSYKSEQQPHIDSSCRDTAINNSSSSNCIRVVNHRSNESKSCFASAKKSLFLLIRLAFFSSLFGALVAGICYTMGFLFLAKLAIIGIVVYLASGSGGLTTYLYVAYKTISRDAKALFKYILFQAVVYYLKYYNYTIKDMFNDILRKHPKKVLLVMDDDEWTAERIEEYSNKVANAFKNMGLKKGDVVAIMLENKPEYACIWLGLSKLGVVTALINFNLRQNSLAHCVNISKCSIFLYEDVFIDAVEESKHLLENVDMYCWHRSDVNLSPSKNDWINSIVATIDESPSTPPFISDKLDFHDVALYIYTSGTTGLPKAAVISVSRALFLTGAIRYQMGWSEKDKFYTPLPMYHTAGGITCVCQAIMYGSCVVIRKKFSASAYFSDITRHNCTIAQYIGEMCRYVLSTPPSPDDRNHNLKMVFGNGLRPQIWREFVTRFNIPKVGEFYGATEGNANIVNVDNKEGAIGFISRICPQVYPISIIKVDDATGEPIRNAKGLCIVCKPGEPGVFIGKISANPARAFLGYVNEKESEKKIVRDVFKRGDSAFISGDIIEFDKYGYLYFKDRTGDTFRWKGENVSTSEVEAIVSNLVQYRDCVVYGVEVPGTEGRAGMAAIVDEANNVDLIALSDGLKKQLPPYAKPIFLRLLNTVEMTGTYKLKKLDLQKEGLNPVAIKDKLYYLNAKGQYECLTEQVYQDIQNGQMRF